jgi:D-alanine-D-alanine ligase
VWEVDFGTADSKGAAIATRNVKWDRKYRSRHGIGSHAARLSVTQRQRIEALAKRVYRALSLSGYARIDLRMDADDNVYVLEANANPCLTAHEDFARSAAAAGDEYAALLQQIIQLGKRYRAAWRDN